MNSTAVTKDELLEQLMRLTKGMDIPVHRRESPKWLSRNLGVRNSKHPNYLIVVEVVKELVKMGV